MPFNFAGESLHRKLVLNVCHWLLRHLTTTEYCSVWQKFRRPILWSIYCILLCLLNITFWHILLLNIFFFVLKSIYSSPNLFTYCNSAFFKTIVDKLSDYLWRETVRDTTVLILSSLSFPVPRHKYLVYLWSQFLYTPLVQWVQVSIYRLFTICETKFSICVLCHLFPCFSL